MKNSYLALHWQTSRHKALTKVYSNNGKFEHNFHTKLLMSNIISKHIRWLFRLILEMLCLNLFNEVKSALSGKTFQTFKTLCLKMNKFDGTFYGLQRRLLSVVYSEYRLSQCFESFNFEDLPVSSHRPVANANDRHHSDQLLFFALLFFFLRWDLSSTRTLLNQTAALSGHGLQKNW